jgi:hypothetical protein
MAGVSRLSETLVHGGMPCRSSCGYRWIADDAGWRWRVPFIPNLLPAYLSGHGSMINGNALS